MLPVIQTSTIILWTELFPKKRREKIQGEILQSIFEYSGVPHSYKIPSNTKYSTVFLHAIQQLQVILHTELILLQEILQLQGSSRAGFFQQLFPVSPSILHGRIRLPAPLQHSRATQHKQASSEFYPVETAFQVAGSIHAVPTVAPRPVLHYRILPGEIGFFPKGLSIVCPCNTKVSVFQFTYSCPRIIPQEY